MIKEGALRIAKIVLGVLCIIVGIVGLVLPVIPGFVFLFFGLELLGFGLVMREYLKRAQDRFSKPDESAKKEIDKIE